MIDYRLHDKTFCPKSKRPFLYEIEEHKKTFVNTISNYSTKIKKYFMKDKTLCLKKPLEIS